VAEWFAPPSSPVLPPPVNRPFPSPLSLPPSYKKAGFLLFLSAADLFGYFLSKPLTPPPIVHAAVWGYQTFLFLLFYVSPRFFLLPRFDVDRFPDNSYPLSEKSGLARSAPLPRIFTFLPPRWKARSSFDSLPSPIMVFSFLER